MTNPKHTAWADHTISTLASKSTAEELIEIGVMLIARGLYRTDQESGVKEAVLVASSVSSTFSSMHLDLLRRSMAS